MSPEPLRLLLAAAEEEPPLLSADAVAPWPAGALEDLVSSGLLAEIEPAAEVFCDSCSDQHAEGVVWLPGEADGPPRAFIVCRHAGRVSVDLGRLRQWRVALGNLAGWVAKKIGLGASIEALAPGRVWHLGALVVGRREHDVVLARGLWWPDGRVVLEGAFQRFGSASVILLSPAISAPLDSLPEWTVKATALTEALSVDEGVLVLDRKRLGIPSGRRAPGKEPRPKKTIRPPASGAWSDVRIALEEHGMTVFVDGRVETLTAAEAGFGDLRSEGKPNRLWTLLRTFALSRGFLPAGKGKARQRMAQSIADFRKRLKELVPLGADPISYDKKAAGYRIAPRLLLTSGPVFPDVPKGARWEDVMVSATPSGALYISIRDRAETFELIELGFGDIRGTANESGRLFHRLVRGESINATSRLTDPVLIVNKNLKEAFPGLVGEPLTVDEGVWRPVFGIGSSSAR